jgi:hypothetical protein
MLLLAYDTHFATGSGLAFFSCFFVYEFFLSSFFLYTSSKYIPCFEKVHTYDYNYYEILYRLAYGFPTFLSFPFCYSEMDSRDL